MKRLLFVTMATAIGLVGCDKSERAPEPKPAPTATPTPAPAPAPTVAPAAAAEDPWKNEGPKKDPLKRPLLWSIEKGGTTSYALGTIHVGVDAEARLPALVWDKLDAAPAFAMESDLTDPALQRVLECVKCSLRKELGEKHWAKLEEVLGKATAERIDGMKPMVAATMLSLHGLPTTTQMDGLLLARAQNGKKKVVYLEAAKDAAKVLEKWMNVKALKAMLEDFEGSKRNTQQLLEAYVAGDDEKMVTLASEERKQALKHGYTEAELEEQMADMLYNRNAAWLPAIEKLHAEGGGFIAVGALHLVGPKSVLEMLAGKGYKIVRLTP